MNSIADDLHQEGFAVTSNWLCEKELAILNDYVDQLKAQNLFHEAKIGKGQNLHREENVRSDLSSWLNWDKLPLELNFLVEKMQALKQECNQSLYLNLKNLEMHFALYPEGSFYKRHVDCHRESSRKLSIVIYLNQKWKDEWGGDLVLYAQDEIIKTIRPQGGVMVCFLSESFPHEVKTAFHERRSLTGWFHDSTQGVL